MTTRLQQLLEDRRRDVLDAWAKRAAVNYPKGIQDLLGRGGDDFANPAMGVLREAMARLLPALAEGAEREELAMILDTPIRLHAVQGLQPSAAVAFVLELKQAVHDVLGRERKKGGLDSELHAFEKAVDQATLVAFDGYMGCREQALRLRTADERRATLNYLRHAGLAVPKEVSPSEIGEEGTA